MIWNVRCVRGVVESRVGVRENGWYERSDFASKKSHSAGQRASIHTDQADPKARWLIVEPRSPELSLWCRGIFVSSLGLKWRKRW